MKYHHFLKNLERIRFSGQFTQVDPAGQQWIFYLSQGSIAYATGGVHSVRRWRRNLALYCPRMPDYRLAWQSYLASISPDVSIINWEHALLELWVARQKISSEQATKMIQSAVVEVLFDLLQTVESMEQIKQDSPLTTQLGLIKVEEAIAAAQLRWQAWQNAKLTDYSPNQAPVIRQPKQLQQHTPEQFYQTLATLLNGERTLYDLATQMQRDVVEVGASLLPFIHLGWVELINIADLPAPRLLRLPAAPALAPASPTLAPAAPALAPASPTLAPATPALAPVASASVSKPALIACIDDSALVRQMMEKLMVNAGYQFISVEDPLRAIGVLLAHKPDFIFLDLVMPNANGYEVCQQLRKLSCFRNTPIVFLTGSDGYANRLRSNFVGASDFLAKPLDAEAVLGAIRKHLELSKTSLSAVNDR